MASDAPASFFCWVAKDKCASKGNLDFTDSLPSHLCISTSRSHCGVCASDIHTLRSGSAETDYPIVVGHEIVGNVVRKGKNAMRCNGDRVGVGAQCYSCLNCDQCNKGNEPYCVDHVWTYGMRFADGAKSYGGYAEYGRYSASFAFKLPESIPNEIAPPMLCGGLTVYSPLKRYSACPEKTIGIVGIGVLGYFGILFASALGATKIYAISRTRGKEADFRAMGATDFIAIAEPGWVENNLRSIDLIVCTANDTSIPMSDYLRLLKFGGTLVQVGMKDMLELAATKKVNSWIEAKPISNVNEVIQLMEDGNAHYRYVLVNYCRKCGGGVGALAKLLRIYYLTGLPN
ncbi:chaperonin 10-like protein [Lipomyces starkeyi]